VSSLPADLNVGFAFLTGRLHVRPLIHADEDLFRVLYTDPETMRFIGPPLSQDGVIRTFQTALRLTNRVPTTQYLLAMVCRTTLHSVGICSIQGIDAARRRAEAGMIIKPAARRLGLAEECLIALVTTAFGRLPIDEVWAEVARDNAVVERLMMRVGFSRTGKPGPGHCRPEHVIWSALRRAWPRTAAIKH
jgi:RimJ/RimL family protein N-acetyltransferase